MDPGKPVLRASGKLEFMAAVACGVTVANLYVAQPLLGDIAATLAIPDKIAGLIVTLAQSGYAVGLLFIVPLGDLLENRTLAAGTMALTASPSVFLVATFFLGVGLVTVQILLPYAAALADPARQGQVVGRIMAGVLTGIMVSRPVSGLLADLLGWRGVFGVSATLCLAVIAVILLRMPRRVPVKTSTYSRTLKFLWDTARYDRLLQRRAIYQFLMFYSYTAFWTVLPLLLAQNPYELSHLQIAAVALAGAAGAIMSPVAGRIADKGLTEPGTIAALCTGTLAWILAAFGNEGGVTGLTLIIFAALLLDGAVPVSLVISQRELFAANPMKRATLNGLLMALFFTGGAAGASIGVLAFETFGWSGAIAAGATGPALALALAVTSTAHKMRQHEYGETK